jgi:hypothetical protein
MALDHLHSPNTKGAGRHRPANIFPPVFTGLSYNRRLLTPNQFVLNDAAGVPDSIRQTLAVGDKIYPPMRKPGMNLISRSSGTALSVSDDILCVVMTK